MLIIIFFIFGLIIGSFLNVVVYRLKVAEDLVFSRSHCPHCKKIIRWYDNIPVVSFILLKFQCRECKKKISWQYPAVEMLTGLLFALCGAYFFNIYEPSSWSYAIYVLGIISALIAIFAYDFLYLEIPDMVLWPAVVWAISFGLFFSWNHAGAKAEQIPDFSIFSMALGASFGFAFFFFLSKISHEKWMGMGDAYLAILLGLVLGWPQILLALFLAFLIGSIYGIILIATGKYTLKSQVPFAPFLVFGTMITMFFYEPIIDWYLRLFLF